MAQNPLKIDFGKAKQLIETHHDFLLLSHEFTDGDDLGAMLALAHALAIMQKNTTLVAKNGVPDNLLFLPGQHEVRSELPASFVDQQVLVTIGCGQMERTGFPELSDWTKPILNIDHHHDSQMFGTVNVWDEHASANCELVYRMLREWNIWIDKAMAMALLTGLFTDTGGFRHANVTAATLEIAAELLRSGARLDLISRFTLQRRDLPMLRAWAVAIEHARLDPERKIIYTVITEDDLAKVGAKEQDLEGVVELLNTIPEAKFSLLLKQRGDEVKGSLRSEPEKGVDVSQIARALGGGGHKLAAGFKFKGAIEKTGDGWKLT